jgi:hypothetical protein
MQAEVAAALEMEVKDLEAALQHKQTPSHLA